jgi:hypothetical protein
MNDGSASTSRPHRTIRLARAVVPVILVFLAVSVGPLWLRTFFLNPRLHGVYVVFLLGVEVLHGLLVATVPIAAIALAVALARARGRPPRRTWLVRGLSLCLSIGLGLTLAEAAAGAWLAPKQA